MPVRTEPIRIICPGVRFSYREGMSMARVNSRFSSTRAVMKAVASSEK